MNFMISSISYTLCESHDTLFHEETLKKVKVASILSPKIKKLIALKE